MAPMTRCRARDTLATPAMQVYYGQRATAGGLLVSEGVCVAPNAHGYALICLLRLIEQSCNPKYIMVQY